MEKSVSRLVSFHPLSKINNPTPNANPKPNQPMKLSSIDWLISQLQKAQDFQRVLSQVSQTSSASIDIIATTKEMHLEDMQNAYNLGVSEAQKKANEKQT
jgi:hypothetical protein